MREGEKEWVRVCWNLTQLRLCLREPSCLESTVPHSFSTFLHVPGQNAQLLLIRVLVPWAQTMKLLTWAGGGKRAKERPGNFDMWSTPYVCVWCGEICRRRPKTVYMMDTLSWWTPGCHATSELLTTACQTRLYTIQYWYYCIYWFIKIVIIVIVII